MPDATAAHGDHAVGAREALVESTLVELEPNAPYRERFHEVELAAPRRKHHQEPTFAVVQIVRRRALRDRRLCATPVPHHLLAAARTC